MRIQLKYAFTIFLLKDHHEIPLNHGHHQGRGAGLRCTPKHFASRHIKDLCQKKKNFFLTL